MSRSMVTRRKRETRGVGAFLDLLPPRPFQPLGVGEHRVEGTELPDQLGRRLLPDPGNAGDVVGRVSRQRKEIGHLPRGNAEDLLDLRLPHGVLLQPVPNLHPL